MAMLALNGNHHSRVDDRVGDSDAIALAKACAAVPSALPTLLVDMSYSRVGDEGAVTLAEALERAPIVSLSLKANDVGPAGVAALARAATGARVALRELDLSGNNVGDAGLEALAAALRAGSPLEHMRLSNAEVGTTGIVAFASALRDVPVRLRLLELSNPRLFSRDEDTTYHLGRALAVCRSLKVVKFERHPLMTDAGVAVLAELLEPNRTLRALSLAGSRLAGGGAAALARLAIADPALRTVRLEGCRIGDEGALAWAAAIRAGAGVRRLDLRRCEIGDRGLAALMSVLEEAASRSAAEGGRRPIALRQLLLWGNVWGATSREMLGALADAGVAQTRDGGGKIVPLDLGLGDEVGAVPDRTPRAGEVVHFEDEDPYYAHERVASSGAGPDAEADVAAREAVERRGIDPLVDTLAITRVEDGHGLVSTVEVWVDCRPFRVDGRVQVAEVRVEAEM